MIRCADMLLIPVTDGWTASCTSVVQLLLFLLQLYSMDKRLGSCCVYVVTSQSSRGLHDVSKVFSVTSETGIVYVSEPERLVELEHDNITVGLFIVVNGSRHDDMVMVTRSLSQCLHTGCQSPTSVFTWSALKQTTTWRHPLNVNAVNCLFYSAC